MNQTVSRVLWILAGVLLIIAGVICLINPGAAWTTLSLYLGISMLLSGVIDLATTSPTGWKPRACSPAS